MSLRLWRCLATSALSILLPACHFERSFELESTVDPDWPDDAHHQPCLAVANGNCEYDQRCYPDSFAQTWDDADQCAARRTIACELAASNPRSAYDESAIRACTPPLDLPCPGAPNFQGTPAMLGPQCPQPTKGLVPEGGVCSLSSECRSGWCSLSATPNETHGCGVCLPVPCGGSCPPDQVCVLDSQAGSRCVPRLAADGEACEKAADCSHYFCRGGVCQPLSGTGEICAPSPGTGPSCEGGNFCNRDTGRCEAFLFARASEPCGVIGAHVVLCAGASSCPGSDPSVCIPAVPDGQLCDPSQALSCLAPARCIDGFCRFRPPSCP